MPFKRVWDSTCPRVWDRWETEGKTYVIQDLTPEDDEAALRILEKHLIPDEQLCIASKLAEDPVSVGSILDMWKNKLSERMSLGCYTEVGGKKNLIALNACYVICIGDKEKIKIEGKSWKNVYSALEYTNTKCNEFDEFGADMILYAMGLVVVPQHRGAKLGGRILAAREPLCRSQGIKATETVFTGPASQKLATRCGFDTLLEVSFKELADNGLEYPRVDKVIKVMRKKYE